jgi:hypothetical protein
MVNDIPLAVERFVGIFGIKAIHLAYKHVKCPQTVSVMTRGGLKVGSLIQAKKGCLAAVQMWRTIGSKSDETI